MGKYVEARKNGLKKYEALKAEQEKKNKALIEDAEKYEDILQLIKQELKDLIDIAASDLSELGDVTVKYIEDFESFGFSVDKRQFLVFPERRFYVDLLNKEMLKSLVCYRPTFYGIKDFKKEKEFEFKSLDPDEFLKYLDEKLIETLEQ